MKVPIINPNAGLVKNLSHFFKRIFEPFKTLVKNISNAIFIYNKIFENSNIVNQNIVEIRELLQKVLN